MTVTQSSRLYGKYLNYSTMSREQALLRAAAQVSLEGPQPSLGLMAHTQYRKFLEDLGLNKSFIDMNAVSERGLVANVGFSGVSIHGMKGKISIIATAKGLPNECILIRPEDWKLHSCGPALSLEDHDGLTIARHPTEDSYEGRMVFRGNLSCKRPGSQARVVLPSA